MLSIIIPAYNEANRLPSTLKTVTTWLTQQKYHHEIIVVDDGSTDKTSQFVKTLKNTLPSIQLVTHEKNLGKGAAVKTGMALARGDIRLFMDADHSTHIKEIEKALPLLKKGADIILASRQHPDSNIKQRQRLVREYMGRTFNTLIRYLIQTPIKDTQCGFKVFTAASANTIFEHLQTKGFAFDVEILYLAHLFDYQIAEIPVEWTNDPESKVKIIAHSWKMLVDVLRLRLFHARQAYAMIPKKVN